MKCISRPNAILKIVEGSTPGTIVCVAIEKFINTHVFFFYAKHFLIDKAGGVIPISADDTSRLSTGRRWLKPVIFLGTAGTSIGKFRLSCARSGRTLAGNGIMKTEKEKGKQGIILYFFLQKYHNQKGSAENKIKN